MSDYTVEATIDDTATISAAVAGSGFDLEVSIESVSKTGTATEMAAVEVDWMGPMGVPDGTSVKNVGGASGLLVLATGAAVPVGTPSGTIILRQ